MAQKIDWTETLTGMGEELHEETLDVLKKHETFLKDVAKSELIMILTGIVGGSREDVDAAVFMAMLQQIDDNEFVSLRAKTVESARSWAVLDGKKRVVVDDLMSKVKSKAATFMIKVLLMSI